MSWCFCGDTVHRDTSLYTYISYLHMWWFALPYFPSSGILWILAACRSNSSDGLSREMYAHICPCDCFFTECPSGCSISSILLYVLTVSCNSLFSHFVHSRVQQLTRVCITLQQPCQSSSVECFIPDIIMLSVQQLALGSLDSFFTRLRLNSLAPGSWHGTPSTHFYSFYSCSPAS